MLPNYMPNEETLKKRREPKFVIDPKDVTVKDQIRIRQWALEIMQKHTSRLKDEVPDKQIVFEKELEPEDIDIRNIYPFAANGTLGYMIFRKTPYWCLRLLYKTATGNYSILAELSYANVEQI